MSDPSQLFAPEDIQEVIGKLQAGNVIGALNQVLSNSLVSEIASRQAQINSIMKARADLQARADALQAEINALLAGSQ